MSEEANPSVVNPPDTEPAASRSEEHVKPDVQEPGMEVTNGTVANGDKEVETTSPDVAMDNAPVGNESTNIPDDTNEKQTTPDDVTQSKPATTQEDIEMDDDTKASDTAPAAEGSAEPAAGTPASASKPQARRKSGGVPEHKGKKLNKKASKAKMTHTDAQPGDYFYVRLKGYPLWPAIVCDESMLPNTLLKSRPVTAARPDGTYREDYQDGGSKVKDRTFPVMYLHTNEFGFIPNHDLVEIDFDDVANVTSNMRKDLAEARRLAAEKHDLDYFKGILQDFMEQREADKLAKDAAKAEKKAKKAAKKDRKSTATVVESDEDGDVDMADAIGEPDIEEAEPTKPKKNGNGKRENEDVEPRTESVKKPRIKLNTPKTINGTSTPKVAKDPAAPKSSAKPRKKATPKVKAAETPEVVVPKEPELTAEEKRLKKEKEILFLRHKLQKGLLTRDQEPKVEEMKSMSEYVSKLEGYADLEVSIIRTTKINKVLKAILKLSAIPKEEEYKFKPRSQALLDKWNKLLAGEGTPAVAPAASNGTAAETKSEVEDGKASPAEPTNGTKESSADEKAEEKSEEQPDEKVLTEEPSAPKAKDVSIGDSALAEEAAEDSVEEPASVEATA